MAVSSADAESPPLAERAARRAERIIRIGGDGRTGVALLAVAGLANLVAALVPGGAEILAGPAYAILLGAVALSGVAAVATRAPAAWREWRRPGPVPPGAGALTARVEGDRPADGTAAGERLRTAGYRTRLARDRSGWAVHGVRRGWSRFAGMLSHLAMLGIVIGVATGAAFGSETTFTLLPGDQALLGDPRPGFSSAMRLDAFDAEFGPDGRPSRLDTQVTFLRDGAPVSDAILRVNEPGSFDGHLVHPWTYGPAARLRVATLGGGALLDAPVPLDEERDGTPVGAAVLPSVGLTLGLAITDSAANELGLSVVDGSGLVDTVRLRPGEEARVGDLVVRFDRFDAWVTFLSRTDPGLGILALSGAALCGSLAVAMWLPRRRVTVRPRADGIEVLLRGERYDRPVDELDRLVERLRASR
jgi:cytochrome c biogenesis protein